MLIHKRRDPTIKKNTKLKMSKTNTKTNKRKSVTTTTISTNTNNHTNNNLPIHPYKDEILNKLFGNSNYYGNVRRTSTSETVLCSHSSTCSNDGNNTSCNNGVLLVTAQTGSGKSTQVPQFIFHYMNRFVYNKDNINNSASKNKHKNIIGVTQPRRVAAISVAQRVSQEMNSNSKFKLNCDDVIGRTVGYRVRFDDCSH